jgi:prepilin-type N-terminal cleavage/methylation domain-containing protein/prepilin-type processing-associated H-X9-DG protein
MTTAALARVLKRGARARPAQHAAADMSTASATPGIAILSDVAQPPPAHDAAHAGVVRFDRVGRIRRDPVSASIYGSAQCRRPLWRREACGMFTSKDSQHVRSIGFGDDNGGAPHDRFRRVPPAARRGFTLVELLVVIGIIAVLIALLFPALRAARIQAQRAQCASNMRQISMAIIGYTGQHNGVYPLKDNPLTSYLYFWSKSNTATQCVLDLMLTSWGMPMEILTCPSQQALFNPPAPWPTDPTGQRYGVNYCYLGGMGEPKHVGVGSWYEDPPSAPERKSRRANSVILADVNIFFNSPDNGLLDGGTSPNHYWLFSNHGRENMLEVRLANARSVIRGSNRCYADGHVEWVHPDQMGKNNGPMPTTNADTTLARYDDNMGYAVSVEGTPYPASGLRLYFW